MIAVRAVECAVARYWPDFARIRQTTGASTDDVARVIARMEAIDLDDREAHVCLVHVAGSARCRKTCGCRCRDCKAADNKPRRLRTA